jgi:hypothetical protein
VEQRFDRGRPQLYFTARFLKNHVYVGNQGAKKRAEMVFQRRGKTVSTVLCLTRSELVQLAGEIHNNQDAFGRSPRQVFTTKHAYDYWSRGGSQSKDKQRATAHCKRFEYKVLLIGEIYALDHFHG